MALTRTTLAAAVADANDTTISVSSATGFAADQLVRIDNEWMVVQKTYTTGTIPRVLERWGEAIRQAAKIAIEDVLFYEDTYEKMRYAQALLGHQPRAAELAAMLDRAFDALIGQLEKSKFAATPRPRPGTRRATGPSAIWRGPRPWRSSRPARRGHPPPPSPPHRSSLSSM